MFGLQHKVCFSMFFWTVSPILFRRKPGPGRFLNFSAAKGYRRVPCPIFKSETSLSTGFRGHYLTKNVFCSAKLLSFALIAVSIFYLFFLFRLFMAKLQLLSCFCWGRLFPQYLCSLFYTFHTVFFLWTFHMSAIFNTISPPQSNTWTYFLGFCVFLGLEVVVVKGNVCKNLRLESWTDRTSDHARLSSAGYLRHDQKKPPALHVSPCEAPARKLRQMSRFQKLLPSGVLSSLSCLPRPSSRHWKY